LVSYYELVLTLNKLIRSVQSLEKKMESLPRVLSSELNAKFMTLSFKATDAAASTVTLSVAENKTLETLKRLPRERLTAEDVAVVTKRARAVESAYLNILSRRGIVMRERKGRNVFFFLKEGCDAER